MTPLILFGKTAMMTNGRIDKPVYYQSVTGVSHMRKNIPCQDASGVFVSSDGNFRIGVVADGHGDHTCMRSEKGSRLAVSTVIGCLKEFGRQYPEFNNLMDSYPGEYGRHLALQQLFDSIACFWSEQVLEDYQKNPLTEEERADAGKLLPHYERGEHLERIYGTTLVAALEAKDYVLLLQQGDGRCDLLFDNGTMQQPIAEDKRCYANVTTSLSDNDVARRIRGKLIVGQNHKLIACFVGTDGLDNAFFEDDELYAFYMRMIMDLAACNGYKETSEHLGKMLTSVSRNGNGDDVSIAGLIASDAAVEFARNKLTEKRMEANYVL